MSTLPIIERTPSFGSTLHALLVVLLVAGSIAACSGSRTASEPVVDSPYSGPAIDPRDYGYPVSIKEIEQINTADSAFVPISVKDGMQKAFGTVEYPQKALDEGVTGRIAIDVFITEEGQLDRMRAQDTSPMILLKAAGDAIQQWEFTPATLHGQPVPSFIRIPFNFQMATQGIDVDDSGNR